MHSLENIHKCLLSYTWKESFNTWTFGKTTITIKDYSRSNFEKVLHYTIDNGANDALILRTNDSAFGNFSLSFNESKALPRVILTSVSRADTYFELQAFNTFSAEQKHSISSRILLLKDMLEKKRIDLENSILKEVYLTSYHEKILRAKYEHFIHRMENRIQMMEMVVQTTIDLATDYAQYIRILENDIDQLEQEIRLFDSS